MACQLAANHNWTLTHMDTKTVFLQGDRCDETRIVLTALPKEAGYPPHMAARMKKPAYGLRDAPMCWFNIIGAGLRQHECVPTRRDRCLYLRFVQQDSSCKGASFELQVGVTSDSWQRNAGQNAAPLYRKQF